MRILVQWATTAPGDWVEMDSADWALIPFRPTPGPGSRASSPVDGSPGWVHALCVQGVVFQGDHYHVVDLPGGRCLVSCWNDDPDDWGPSEYLARSVLFEPLQPDPLFGGAINTRQTWHVYAADRAGWEAGQKAGHGAQLRDYDWFQAPSHGVGHGVWLTDQNHADLEAARSIRGWREWTDGLPDFLLSDGRVVQQRRIGRYDVPKGTRTYYNNDNTQSWTVHNAAQETTLGLVPGPVGTRNGSCSPSGDLLFLAVSPSGEPDSAAWPTGTYRYQLDAVSAGANITYGLLTQGGAVGHFGRVNAAADTDLETHAQDQAAFSGSGLKLASYTGSWTAGAVSDRWEVLVAGVLVSGHGSQNLTLELGETDDFTDGPWPAAEVVRDANFFGMGI